MARLQRFIVIGIVVAIVAVAVYGYYTDQLPIRRPGGSVIAPPTAGGQLEAPRAAPGQQFTFGAGTYTVTTVERAAELGRGRPAPRGTFISVQMTVRNGGREPLTFTPASFELFDRNGRRFTIDPEATRLSADERRVDLSKTTIQPGLGVNGLLVFDIAPDASGLVLRITQGYQDVALNQ